MCIEYMDINIPIWRMKRLVRYPLELISPLSSTSRDLYYSIARVGLDLFYFRFDYSFTHIGKGVRDKGFGTWQGRKDYICLLSL